MEIVKEVKSSDQKNHYTQQKISESPENCSQEMMIKKKCNDTRSSTI